MAQRAITLGLGFYMFTQPDPLPSKAQAAFLLHVFRGGDKETERLLSLFRARNPAVSEPSPLALESVRS